MMSITDFTAEEIQLIALYMPKENRLQLIKEIVRDRENRKDMEELAERVVDKLAKMTDREFNSMDFVTAI